MIRRISKNNDYRDIVRTCPSGDIEDIFEIRYYISIHPDVEVDALFEKKGHFLEVFVPSQDLQALSDGVLMRKCCYRVSDSSYPDGYYNLEFIDELNVWLSSNVDDSVPTDYLRPSDLKTVNYQSLVGEGNIEVSIPSYYATKSWVSEQGYLKSVPSGYATQSWVVNQGYLTSVPSAYATESWVVNQGYLTSIPSEYVTESWVNDTLSSYALSSDVPSLDGYATESWVISVLSSYTPSVSGYATQSWVTETLSSYALSTDIPSLEGYATQSWVESQGYIKSIPSDIATQSWVNNTLSSYALSTDIPSLEGYATQSWVSNQGYLKSVPSGYATQSWVLSQNYYTPGSSETVLCTIQPTDLNPIVSTPLIIGNYMEGGYIEGVEIGAGGLTVVCHHYQESQMSQDYAYQVLTESNFSWYLDGYATESWVSSNFLSTTALTGYATESWVSSQGYLKSVPSNYATQSWVTSQGYLTSVPTNYATKSWVSSNYLPQSEVWTGTMSEWVQLTSAQRAAYIIALITD